MTSKTAPAHPHATGVAVYPALFSYIPIQTEFQAENGAGMLDEYSIVAAGQDKRDSILSGSDD